ncbi:MAG TPA: hypothetical protein VF945_05695 [Polyangia bacterium]
MIAGIAVALFVALLPSHRIAPDRHLPPPERLSEAARAALTTQMRTHARGMMELVSRVTLLDYDGVGAAAQRVLDEPRVARPLTHDASELNSSLPARFFALQDELRLHLQATQQAAGARDPEALAESFAATTRTCVRCHDAYLSGR